ncbi:hypothetical protein P389DRAFT_197652 [Cystobasidium minutum MCA 4210]|uniref:uncharacterized protein n=1 Tax=Cystobasidium minutum MCA 4210 TaxID=1397322 RepID=UPI0034CE6D31|eukprot:jgi/Rhomi1/197652/gm1.5866_g
MAGSNRGTPKPQPQSQSQPAHQAALTTTTTDDTAIPAPSPREGRPAKRARAEPSAPKASSSEDKSDRAGIAAGVVLPDKNSSATLPSCSECKRRKVKCDRKVPCTACVKRGAPDTCKWSWNDNIIDPLLLFTKLTGDIEALQARLAEVEDQLRRNPANVQPTSTFHDHAIFDAIASVRSSLPPSDHSPYKEELHDTPALATVLNSAPLDVGSTSSSQKATYPSAVPSRMNLGQHTDKSGPQVSRGSSGTLEAEYDAAAENAAIYLESFANQGPRTEDSQTPVSPQHPLDTHVATHNVPWQDMELTEALTSIKDLSPRVPYQDTHLAWFPYSTDGLNYASARTKALQEVYTYLPTAAQTEYLIQLFEEKVHWRFTIVHLPALRLEIKRLWEMFAAGRQLEVDPLWLGVLFMVLALGMNNHPTTPSPSNIFPGLTTEQISALATGYHSASLKALHIGDCMGKPRPRTVQAICLFAVYFQQFLQPAAGPSSAERMLHWLAIAIRSAQMMGLHSLGSDPEVMPPDDPAWPPGKNAFKRQLALRLWANLQWADWMSATSSARSYSIHPSYCTSVMVANVNDWELSLTDWKINPHPPNVITSTAFHVTVWHIANVLRMTYDKVVTNASTFCYDTVMELDREYQKMLDELPLLSDRADESKLSETTYMQRHIALIGTHSRIARLHRPYLSRGYTPGSRFSYSRDRCLWSAGIMVQCHYKVKEITSRGSFWFAFSHSLNAAMVLFLDLLWSIDNDLPISELIAKRKTLLKIQEIYSNSSEIANKSLREMVGLSHRVITGLLRECSARQTTRLTALFNNTDEVANSKPETFASILRRVSLAVQKEHEQKMSQQPSQLGSNNMQMQPAIVGADSASFHFLLDPFNTNAPLYAPTQASYNGNQLNTGMPTDDTNSAIAANFAGLNGLDDLFEMGHNDRYNFNLWSLPNNQSQAPLNTPYYAQDQPEEDTSRILRQLMGFEPSYSGTG